MQYELVITSYLFREAADEPPHQGSPSHSFNQGLPAGKVNFNFLRQLGAGGL